MSVHGDDSLVEVLARNEQYWANKNVLVVGEINALQLLPQLVHTTSATVLCDNYETAQGLSAMMGVTLKHGAFAIAQKKHVTVIFGNCHDPRVKAALKPFDVLLLFLSKTKSLSQDLLAQLKTHFAQEQQVLILGSNAIGGKSADSLIRDAATVSKIDTARKCTVYLGQISDSSKLPAPKALSEVSFLGQQFTQWHGLFSQGQLDDGTSLLLQALHQDLSADPSQAIAMDAPLTTPLSIDPYEPILDLGCGSGIIGLSLAARGCTQIVSSDISATALYATEQNAKRLGYSSAINIFACNMLPNATELEALKASYPDFHLPYGKFKLIVTNPPFHQGLSRTTSPTEDMIMKAPDYLSDNGALYLVGNTCLHYERALEEAFAHVTALKSTNKFTVFKATN